MSFPTSRRRFLTGALSLAALVPAGLTLTGCPSSGGGDTASATAGGTTGAAPTPGAAPSGGGRKIKAGLVTDVGGVNDRSFNTMANEGLKQAEKQLGADIKVQESKAAGDYTTNLSRFAQAGYDVVFAVGFKMQDALKDVAPRFPKVKFAIIDGDAPDLPNCVAYKFREEQGSYLAGALAGAMTKTGTVGFIGGEEMPLIEKFEVGYKAGVQTTNPKAKVVVGYVGAFNDPQKGQELALSQMGSAKADILYHAAGESGVGVIKAVQERGEGYYAIGVDKDQDDEAPGRVLTSMVKRVDVAVFQVCQAVATDAFKPGTVTVGLDESGVGLSEMKHTKDDVPAEVLAKIDALRTQIIEGKLKPPITRAELAAFKVPAP
ncbi:MAG TPA: BMP family ABC transporter substrate-binding protein [Armatimonadaceae bacterium]|nr:BMP family ABC transporter substrate-binding protein [Armatimonadaceae bacterium]